MLKLCAEMRKIFYKYSCGIWLLICFLFNNSCSYDIRLYQGITIKNNSNESIEILSVKGLPHGYVTDCMDVTTFERCSIAMPPGYSIGNSGFRRNGKEVNWPIVITYRALGGKDIKIAKIESASDGSRSRRYLNSRFYLIYKNGKWFFEPNN